MYAMAETAERWAEILENKDLDEHGLPFYPEVLKERLFARSQQWLREYQRLFPGPAEGEGLGVKGMREWFQDPKNAAFVAGAVERAAKPGKTLARPASGPAGSPPTARDAQRAKDAEGSGLHALVFEGEGLEERD